MVVSCRALGEADGDFAVSFAVPVDTKGIKYIVRPAPNRPGSDLTMECPIGTAIRGRSPRASSAEATSRASSSRT
jgi:aromatic ring hydroxylase